MKKIIPTIILVICFSFYSFSQITNIKGQVKDGNTTTQLSFVSIGIKNTPKGTTSDENGYFTIDISQADTLIFSYIGYTTKEVPFSKLDSVIYLTQHTTKLEEVVVYGKNAIHKEKFGNKKEKTFILTAGMSQYVCFIKNELQKDAMIEKLYFDVRPRIKKEGRWESLVRLRIYENKNSKPANDILTKSITYRLKKNTKSISLDISELNISLPKEGCFVGIEFIGFYDKNEKYVSLNSNKNPISTYLECAEDTQQKYLTYSKTLGVAWQPTYTVTRDGRKIFISAKFEATITYYE